jgi:hypothetical protein
VTNARRKTRTLLVTATLAISAALAVQGCAPGTAAKVTSSTHPDMTVADAQAIYQSYLATSDSAAAAGDSEIGLSNVTNAAWEAVHAQYTALSTTGNPVARYQYGTPTFYVPIVTNYPHWFLAVAPRRPRDASESDSVTTLMVFAQATKTSTWALAGSTALLPGHALPAIALDAGGYATALATYDQSVLLAPDVVGATQASLVDEGPTAEAASVFADSPQSTGLYDQQVAQRRPYAAEGLDYTWQMMGADFPVFALRTANGGGLVLYGIYLDTTIAHPLNVSGPPIPIPAATAPQIAIPGEISNHAVYTEWTYEFAATDPPATASSAKASVIAATGAITFGRAY